MEKAPLAHSAESTSEFFNVTTDARIWNTWGIPDWCYITEETHTGFRLNIRENTSTESRSDYMEVRTPQGHSARIEITQAGTSSSSTDSNVSGYINSITVDHNQTSDGKQGMIIHVNFNVLNMKGKQGSVYAYFYDANDEALVSTGGEEKYETSGSPSYVLTYDTFTPKYDNTKFSDFKLFIPYAELHQSGTSPRTLKFKVCLWNDSATPHNEFYIGSENTFTYSPNSQNTTTPSATINRLWVEHNVFDNGVKGMKVHVDFNVENMKGRTVYNCVYFYKADNRIKLVDGSGNHISVIESTTANYDNSHWEDWWIFVPNDKIFNASNSDGNYSLDVEIHNDNGRSIGHQYNYQFHKK